MASSYAESIVSACNVDMKKIEMMNIKQEIRKDLKKELGDIQFCTMLLPPCAS
jgi:hypothetical protein